MTEFMAGTRSIRPDTSPASGLERFRRLLGWRAWPLKLDRYLLGEVALPFVGATIFLIFVVLMFQALRLAEFLIVHGVGLGALVEMIGLMALSFLPYVLPVAFLIAVLTGFGRLSSDSELVALKANGISLVRMGYPIAALAVGVGFLSLQLNQEWVPWAETRHREMLVRIGNSKAVASVKEGAFTTGFFDLLIYADRVDPVTGVMRRVFIFDEREKDSPVTVVAQEGEVLPVKATPDGTLGVALRLRRGNIHRTEMDRGRHGKIDFQDYRLYLPVSEGKGGRLSFRARMLPQADLSDALRKEKPGTGRWRELQTEDWRRIATALVPLAFLFFGIGFASLRTRVVRVGASWVGLAVVLLYWVLQAWMLNVGHAGALPPASAMLVPNAVVLVLGLAAFRSAMW
jgi:lipopolysaccharide export system permease protein